MLGIVGDEKCRRRLSQEENAGNEANQRTKGQMRQASQPKDKNLYFVLRLTTSHHIDIIQGMS